LVIIAASALTTSLQLLAYTFRLDVATAKPSPSACAWPVTPLGPSWRCSVPHAPPNVYSSLPLQGCSCDHGSIGLVGSTSTAIW
jgi:hypothetical protein